MKYEASLQKLFTGKAAILANTSYAYFLTDEEKELLQRFSTRQEIARMSLPAGIFFGDFFRCLYLI